MKTQDIKNRFIGLRAKGYSYDKIAKQLKVSKQTLITWSKELQAEIANLKTIELEVLLEKYYALREKRIELFGKKLLALEKELSTRDLKDIPTEKLFYLIDKYADLLKQEGTGIIFKEKVSFPDINFEDRINTWEG